MPSERFYVDTELTLGTPVSIEGSELHHLAHVMRVGVGEEVELVNGRGSLAKAVVAAIDKKKAALKVLSCIEEEVGPARLILAIPIMRLSKLEWIFEKGTELGADAFWIYAADYSEKEELFPNQIERLRMIAISALKQSGRLDLPSIRVMPGIEEIFSFSGTWLFGDVNPSAPFLWDAENIVPPILFTTGPERGFSQREEELLKLKAKGVRIHNNILRAETAPIAALSLLWPISLFFRNFYK